MRASVSRLVVVLVVALAAHRAGAEPPDVLAFAEDGHARIVEFLAEHGEALRPDHRLALMKVRAAFGEDFQTGPDHTWWVWL